MWMEHDRLEKSQNVSALIADFKPDRFEGFKETLGKNQVNSQTSYQVIFTMKQHSLPSYPSVITEQEWREVAEFDSIGYCASPHLKSQYPQKEAAAQPPTPQGEVSFDFVASNRTIKPSTKHVTHRNNLHRPRRNRPILQQTPKNDIHTHKSNYRKKSPELPSS